MNDRIESPAEDVVKELVIASRLRDSLSRAQQMNLAAWIVKTDMMLGAYQFANGGTRRCPRSEELFFYRHGVPSAFTEVWIGLLADGLVASAAPVNVQPIPDVQAKIVVASTWTPSLSIQRLYSHTIYQHPDFYAPLELPEAATEYLVRIWPPHETSVPWPPKEMDWSAYEGLHKMVIVSEIPPDATDVGS
jgi:hypothetical protein